MFRLIGYAAAALSALMLALFPAFCNAEEAEEDELTPELIRQIGLLDLEGWDSFFREEGFLSASGFAGADELLLALAEGKTEHDLPYQYFGGEVCQHPFICLPD